MKQRCLNPNTKYYNDYGGRGIKICDRWLNSFENFMEDMGLPPSHKHSIDRIDPEGNYTPENCRWATDKAQARNRRNTVLIKIGDEAKCITDWLRIKDISPYTYYRRIRKGMTPEESLTTPVDQRFNSRRTRHTK